MTPMSPDPAVVQALRAAGCVFAEEEAGLLMEAARSDEDFASMVQQRISGIPLEHILGWAEFCGRRMVVEPGVFVPRRRTEFLVRQAALVAKPGAVVVDLCCGSGAIGAALSDLLGSCQLYGADIDPLAAACAARNIGPRGGQVFQGDLFEPLAPELRGRVDVLLVNAPYVPTGSIAMMPPEVRLHEPMAALDGGGDGLDVQRRVVRDSPEWLSPGGALLIETSDVQASATAALMVGVGLRASVLFDGDLGATVVLGRWP
ncbi:putative protein N(5)-glutamine methyltransferase [Paenarthrobacter ureafaciens]|nr:putative protein N(5)-glutamine methyltransferase [Paenarthrobacter ureafaciens]MCX8456648.1 putative protein N(5)-glutamine methyltransferase [Paenarthrobacter ureafaciens]MCY0974975.1 putative protein N(5)-glutamine methyltransferase [Paenarthrobacter ureafaciens]